MSFIFFYILKLSVSLSVVFLFYHFVLRKLTFYNHNRWYLLGYTLVSFFIPFINISTVLEKNNWNTNDVVTWIPVIHTATVAGSPENTPGAFTMWSAAILIIAAGMVIMLVRLLLRLLSFHRMMKKALPVSTEGMNLYQVNENIIPFSFGNSIFINRHLHSEKELEEIIRHEFVHVKQRHSFDIIWAELLCLANWFNPFAWLLRRSIRQNLEFIADHKVLENGINRKEYQYLLLKVIGSNQYSIATQFNFSSLKKRIAMMNKLQSAKVHLLKFLFLLPVAIVMLLAFRSRESGIPSAPRISNSVTRDTIPDKVSAVRIPGEISSISLMQGKEQSDSKDPIKQKLRSMVLVKRKDGAKEIYNINDGESRAAFEKKYGVKLEDIILPPPPPPPPPPTLPEGVKDMSLNAENIVTVTMENGTIEKFNLNKETEKKNFEEKYGKFPPAPKTPAPDMVYDNGLSTVSNEYEITDKKAVIKLKNGSIEKYDLTNKQERSAFEKKYGRIIHVNTHINASAYVTPVAVTVNGKTMTSTVAPVTIVGAHSATTVIAPAVVTEKPSAISITPVALRSSVSGTTLITPMAATEGVTVIDDYGPTITGNEDIMIVISNKTTRQELEDYKMQMKEKGIELSFDKIEYNDKGLLVSISGTMKGNDGQSNFVATDFEALVLARIKKDGKNWFKVSVKDKKVI
jgi:beta-lactamase regulating signal transducer with metallopeptidase domain